MDTRFLRASTAAAACRAGHFVLLGRALRPFTAHHFAILESFDCRVVTGGELGPIDIAIVARMCCQECPDPAIDFESPAWQAAVAEVVMARDELIVLSWLELCFFSQPAERGELSGGTAGEITADPSQMPLYFHVCHSILAEQAGWTFDDLYFRTPLALLLWHFEGMRELRDKISYIAPCGEPVPAPSQEEMEEEQSFQVRANHFAALIDAHCEAKRLALPPMMPEAREVIEREIELEWSRLFGLALAGRLREDLTEIPEEVPVEAGPHAHG